MRPDEREHPHQAASCDLHVNPCPCGSRWDWYVESADGTRYYIDDACKVRFVAIYGGEDKWRRAE